MPVSTGFLASLTAAAADGRGGCISDLGDALAESMSRRLWILGDGPIGVQVT
jgi:hypothetical protein